MDQRHATSAARARGTPRGVVAAKRTQEAGGGVADVGVGDKLNADRGLNE